MQALRSSSAVARSAVRPAAPLRTSPVVQVDAKLKTRKSAAKRIKVTGSGKLMARHSGKQHLNEKMSREQKRQLGQQFVVDAGNVPQMTKCLPYHGVNGR